MVAHVTTLTKTNVIRVNSRYARGPIRLGIGFVGRHEVGRQIYQGPLVPGPWAYTFPMAVFIDNHGGSAAERRKNIEAGLEYDVEIGDMFEIDDVVYQLTDDDPRAYPTFTAI